MNDYIPLSSFTDKQLKDELKRRETERHSKFPGKKCRDCKHCGIGYTYRNSLATTTICFLEPKPNMGENRFYATNLTRKACEKFEHKDNSAKS